MPNFKSISFKMVVLQGDGQNLPFLWVCYPKDSMWNRVKNHLLTSHFLSKMMLLNNNHYQTAAYFLFPKTDFTSQQIKSFEKSRVMLGKFNQCWSEVC